MVHGLVAPVRFQGSSPRLAAQHVHASISSRLVAEPQFGRVVDGSSYSGRVFPFGKKQSCPVAGRLGKCEAFELIVLASPSSWNDGVVSRQSSRRRKATSRFPERGLGFGLGLGLVLSQVKVKSPSWLELVAPSACGKSGRSRRCFANLEEVNSVTEMQGPKDRESAAMSSAAEKKSLFSKLMQSVNLSGVVSSSRVIVKDRHLAIPHVIVPDISWIDWKALQSRGFHGVLFDKDNTLTAPYAQSIWPSLAESLAECRDVFGGHIALLSNSAGLYQYDPNGDEANALENQFGIPVIRHSLKKPAGDAVNVTEHFGCDADLLVMVGDRYFTDIIYGNRNGLLTIRPSPLTTQGEPFVVKRVRQLEESLVDRWRHRGGQPPKHRFCENPVDFIKDPACW